MTSTTRRAGLAAIAIAAALVTVAGPASADTTPTSGSSSLTTMSSSNGTTPLGNFWTTIINTIGVAAGSSAPAK
ncbi:MAG: hypothetical protein JWN03_8378 [Nocardia sp.]|uniref:hypothetical protein n=1 Tax=Nocardia sp. TaxID=1821 RepID=UPI0026317008|nr:hypothetical protein [Nocardia sp.]MCU1648103.1 hypothetical protein [Nocardia sp.]